MKTILLIWLILVIAFCSQAVFSVSTVKELNYCNSVRCMPRCAVDPEFRNINYTIFGSNIKFEAYLFDASTKKPVVGKYVDIYCDGKQRNRIKTDITGKILVVLSTKCAGSNLWLEYSCDSKTLRSSTIKIPNPGCKKCGCNEVPEFSSVTSVFALVGATLIFIWKRNF